MHQGGNVMETRGLPLGNPDFQEIREKGQYYIDKGTDSEAVYHALFLGMCMTLGDHYHVTSNREYGDGRADIRMESRSDAYPHVVIEFKKGEEQDLQRLSQETLRQIYEKEYTAGLTGKTVCLGLAHSRKKCAAAYEVVTSHDSVAALSPH
jgi:hypothetical protein